MRQHTIFKPGERWYDRDGVEYILATFYVVGGDRAYFVAVNLSTGNRWNDADEDASNAVAGLFYVNPKSQE